MKKLFTLFVTVLSIVTLSGCGGSSSEEIHTPVKEYGVDYPYHLSVSTFADSNVEIKVYEKNISVMGLNKSINYTAEIQTRNHDIYTVKSNCTSVPIGSSCTIRLHVKNLPNLDQGAYLIIQAGGQYLSRTIIIDKETVIKSVADEEFWKAGESHKVTIRNMSDQSFYIEKPIFISSSRSEPEIGDGNTCVDYILPRKDCHFTISSKDNAEGDLTLIQSNYESPLSEIHFSKLQLTGTIENSLPENVFSGVEYDGIKFIFKNTGEMDITDLTLQTSLSAGFSIKVNNCNATLEKNGECSVILSFNSSSTGDYSAQISAQYDLAKSVETLDMNIHVSNVVITGKIGGDSELSNNDSIYYDTDKGYNIHFIFTNTQLGKCKS